MVYFCEHKAKQRGVLELNTFQNTALFYAPKRKPSQGICKHGQIGRQYAIIKIAIHYMSTVHNKAQFLLPWMNESWLHHITPEAKERSK